MAATKKAEAKPTPPKDPFPLFDRRYHAHNPEAGRNESNETFVSAATPQSTPNPIHGVGPFKSSSFRVSQKIKASSNAARLVSHTQRVDQYITEGNSAHVQADQTATFSLKHLREIKKIGSEVKAEKTLLILSKISA